MNPDSDRGHESRVTILMDIHNNNYQNVIIREV